MKLYLILSTLALVGLAHGQMLTPQAGSPPATPAAFSGAGVGLSAPNIPGAPFSADTESRSTRLLPSGEQFQSRSQGKLYRDSQGRTRRETDFVSGSGTVAGRNVVITDPVQHLMMVLNSNDKVARMYHWQPPVAAMHVPASPASANLPPQRPWPGPATSPPTATIQPVAPGTPAFSAPSASNMTVKSDSLGEKELQGVLVTGTRITRTIAPGAAGSSQPVVSTTETWVSPQLKVSVLTEIDNPHGGQTVMALTNIQRTEPDASLFQVPSDYAVEDTAKK